MKERAHWRFARIFVLLAVVVALLAMLGMAGFAAESDTAERECYLSGDLNGDGDLTPKDAIYALYSGFFGQESYPISQDWDYDANGKHNSRDAIELLYACYGMSDKVSTDMVHDYHDPVWSWNDAGDTVSVSVTFKCGCQDAFIVTGTTEGAELTLRELEEQRVEAGCLTSGQRVYQAAVSYKGKEYTSEPYTVTVAPTGHSTGDMVKVEGQPDYHGKFCSACESYVGVAEHNWKENGTVESAMPCSTPSQQKYLCEDCGAEKAVALSLAEHNYQYVEGGDTLADSSCCSYVKHYVCSVCTGEKTPEANDYYTNHDFVATSKNAATCKQSGSLIYTCSHCNAQKEEVIPVDSEAHKWNNGVTENGVTTYTCTEDGCGKTKTAIVATDGEVSKDALNTSGEVELGNATMDLSKVDKETLEEQIKLNVGTEDLDTVLQAVGGAAAAAKDEIKTDKVYDFSMTNSQGQPVIFSGKITITLPYELSEGEDITDIGVYYISDEGNLERISATWSNGSITFEVDHFSYYTVRRLTPAERCEQYGHLWTESTKAATCLENGYTKDVCQRCAAVCNEVVLPAVGHHTYAVNAEAGKAATCLVDGFTVEQCSACGHQRRTIVKATGHQMQTVSLTAASCGKDGEHVTGCINCDYTKTEKLAALTHVYSEEPTQVVAATCTAGGYEVYTCGLCTGTIRKNETQPLGHTYEALENAWTWAEDYTSATVTLTCHCGSTKELKAVATVSKGTCTGAGSASVTVSYNDKKFKDEQITGEAPGHTPGASWATTDSQHYHLCQVCGDKVDIATHDFGEPVITREPTCKEHGSQSSFCAVCGFEKTQDLLPSGKHTFVNGVCVDCGTAENDCDHTELYPSQFDISGFDMCQGTQLILHSCTCGKVQRLELIGDWACDLSEESTREEIDANGMPYQVNSAKCSKCGLLVEAITSYVMAEDECVIYLAESGKLTLNGEVLFAFTHIYSESGYAHPPVKMLEHVDLSELGICEGFVRKYTCPCGEEINYRTETTCKWVEDEAGNEQCMVCGVVRLNQYSFTEDGCFINEEFTVTFVLDGKPVCSYTNNYRYDNHKEQVVDVKMDGTSCTDGVAVTFVCTVCDNQRIEHYEHHAAVIQTRYDLTEYGMCGGFLLQYTCPCGQGMARYELVDMDCQWSYVWDEKTGMEYQVCEKCGTIMMYEHARTEPDENCQAQYVDWVVFYDKDMKELLRGTDLHISWQHLYEYTWTLLGESCTDGVELHGVCSRCGETNSYTNYGHETVLQQRIDLKEMGLCGGYIEEYACPCGQESWQNMELQCCWEGHYGDENLERMQCASCGAVYQTVSTKTETVDSCHDKWLIVTTLEMKGQVLYRSERERTREHHQIVYELQLNEGATSCTDGFKLREHCRNCGEGSDEWREAHDNEHGTYPVSYTLACDEGLCGDLWIVEERCACGEYAYKNAYWENGSCDFEWTMGEDGRERLICRTCGAERLTETAKTRLEGSTCDYLYTNTYTYVKDGVVLAAYSSSYINTRHNIVYEYEMLGESCSDGYYMIQKCQDCDYTYREEELRNDCNSMPVERHYLVRDNSEACGDVSWSVGSCACGEEKSFYWSVNGCEFTYMGHDEATGGYAEQCVKCGLIRTEAITSQRIPGSCKANVHRVYTATLNGEQLAWIEWDGADYNHQYYFEGVFAEGATSCTDGYYIRQICAYCGLTTVDDTMYYGHNDYRLDYYDLESYGMCGGSIECYGCPCGAQMGWQYFTDCDWTFLGEEDPETGARMRHCERCDTYACFENFTEEFPDECLRKGSFICKLIRNDEELLNINAPICRESHTYNLKDWKLNGTSCEDGYEATLVCHCGATITTSGTYHNSWYVQIIDLQEKGACSGELGISRCPCGEYSSVDWIERCEGMQYDSWREDMADGYAHFFEEELCEDCGMKRVREYYEVYPEGSCKGTRYETVTYYLGDEMLYTTENEEEATQHNWYISHVQLREGSQTCEDGVIVINTCTHCGENYTYETHNHERYVAERFDLSQYGSVCGGYLERYVCACGENQHMQFSEDLACDLDRVYIDHWLPNVLASQEQYTAAGHTYFHSESSIYTCAVTDPKCAMQIRYFNGWIQEGCEAVKYQIWQLGYDAETNTWQQEIKIPTGDRKPYHNYTMTRGEETVDGITHYTDTYTCACGSTYVSEEWYNADGQIIKRARNAVEASAERYNKQFTEVTEYNFMGLYEPLETFYREYYLHADGSVYWRQQERTYRTNGTCGYTEVESYSDGYVSTYQHDHLDNSGYNEREYFGCSQPVKCTTYWDCDICGEIVRTDVYYEDPTGHSWVPNENGDGYICDTCGLENSNGADGTIIFEDLTGSEGNGVQYVIGYWNYGEGNFTVYVSAVRNAGTEQEQEVILEGITPTFRDHETDGLNAVCFDKQAVANAAYAAFPEGDFRIRITFVPADGDGTLDYAITLSSVAS